jgi:hypothetical protein
LSLAATGFGQTFNLQNDFVASTSQTGPWFYGHRPEAGGSFSLLDKLEILESVPVLTTLTGQQVWKNTLAGPLFGILPGEISVAPGLLGQPAVVRFIAPKTGTVNISGKFGPGDLGLPRTRTISVNGKEVWRREGNAEETFFFSLALNQGDQVDHEVSDRAAAGQNTPVESEVTYLEPQTIGFAQNTVTGGHTMAASVTLNGVAPAGGVRVNLYVGKPDVLRVPGYVMVPEGQSSANFTITSSAVETDQQVQVTAKANGNHIKSYLRVLAPRMDTFSVVRKVLTGTQSTTATVTLTGPTKNGLTVNVEVDDPTALNVPSTVFIPAGMSSATFTISALDPGVETRPKVTLTHLARTRWIVFTVRPG